MRLREIYEKDILPFFYFSRQERNGAIFLIALLNLTWILPFFFSEGKETISAEESGALDSAFQRLESSSVQIKESASRQKLAEDISRRGRYPSGMQEGFGPVLLKNAFDPNHASEDEWVATGLPARMIRTIGRYLQNGGRFRRPEDLLRIYGMAPGHYQKILPFVRIASDEQRYPKNHGNGIVYPKKESFTRVPSVSIDINLADSAAWESLPGIGPVLASRILRFRDKLGGFVSVDQVREVYGLPDSTYRLIAPRLRAEAPATIVPVLVNTATADELANHPYVSRKLSALLVAYRKQHGPFRQPGDLLAIPLVDSSLLKRIAPYLSMN
jgi:DNA uptake protein ComE-like DNA-binding protein